MSTATAWNDLGTSPGIGQVKRKCPRCGHTRTKHKADRSLSVDRASGLFKCHHCEWSGRVNQDQWRLPRIEYAKPSYRPTEQPTDKVIQWFQGRGITGDVLKRHKIESTNVRGSRMIAFPYYRGEEIVNVKYRSADKQFRMESGAELVLYGWNNIYGQETVILTEGEMDGLSLEVAGFQNWASVPNGAGTNLDIFANDDVLDKATKIIWAGDNDAAGKKLEAEAIRRLGPERCWRVQWPTDCKDANDVLVVYGAEVLRECIDNAIAVPLEGIFEVADCYADVMNLYRYGREPGIHPGWECLNRLYRPRVGDWTVITGAPSSGKSTFLANLLVNIANREDWCFFVYPPENLPPHEYISILAEIYTGMPFEPGPRERMSEELLEAALEWAHEHFIIAALADDQRDFQSFLDLARAYVFRKGVKGIVIDPWNELEHDIPKSKNEHQYIGDSLTGLRQFVRMHGVHAWITVHPTKLQKQVDGQYPVSTLYDCSGSAHWFNKCDYGISVWRDKLSDAAPTQAHVQKVRRRWCGELGVAELYFDRATGKYTERPVFSEVQYGD